MENQFAPARLDIRAFAQSSGQLAGQDPLAGYARIAGECQGPVAGLVVVWSARGEIRASQTPMEQIWLHLHADVQVPLTCQRCLDLVDVTLQVDRVFRFVADEDTAAAQDDDSDEDLLVLTADFNLHELIEDELVLELPMIARHASCPGATGVAEPDFGVAVAGRPNPFAVLARFKPDGGQGTK